MAASGGGSGTGEGPGREGDGAAQRPPTSPMHRHTASVDSDEENQGWSPPQQRRQLPADLPTSLNDRRAATNAYDPGETEVYDPWNGGVQVLKNPIRQTGTAPGSASALRFNLAGVDDDDEDFVRRAEDNDARLMEMLAAQAALQRGGSAGIDGLGDDDGDDDGDLGGSGSGLRGPGGAVGKGKGDPPVDEKSIAEDERLTTDQKRRILQKALHMAASNGDAGRVKKLLDGKARSFVDVNANDEEGTPPLIYASCFGHLDVVNALLHAGASVDIQDQKNQWTALMWAMTNRHKDIALALLENGASPDVQTSSGRRAYDFAQPNSELSVYLAENGYRLGDTGFGDDFYHAGHEDMLELEAEEREMERRMAMARDAAVNLEVDLSNLGMEDSPEDPEEFDDYQEFVWDRCLHDQMFVFQENDLDRILDLLITDMIPQRSQSQKPVPANIIFLAARYAHYHSSPELLEELLARADEKIDEKVRLHQWDMAVLSFWLSNVTLLLYYLQRDPGLIEVSSDFQVQLKGLIEDIFILIVRDAERRINKFLWTAILDYETMSLNIEFANEWRNPFKSKPKEETPDFVSGTRPQPVGTKIRPQNVTSILDSVLYVLDLYDVHSVITTQLVSQILYWISAEIFNGILGERKYMSRSKAMEIRMNLSVLEEWAQRNNRVPEHYEAGSLEPTGESTVEAVHKHFTPVYQLLQWLQVYTGVSDNTEELAGTLRNLLPRLTTQQVLEVCKNYRYEKTEQAAPSSIRKFLQNRLYEERKKRSDARKARAQALKNGGTPTRSPRPLSTMFGGGSPRPKTPEQASDKKNGHARTVSSSAAIPSGATSNPATPQQQQQGATAATPGTAASAASVASTAAAAGTPSSTPGGAAHPPPVNEDEPDLSEPKLLLETNHELGFSAPTSFDMRISYGAGIGGMNRERERKYQPSAPPDFLQRLDSAGLSAHGGGGGRTREGTGSGGVGDGGGSTRGGGGSARPDSGGW